MKNSTKPLRTNLSVLLILLFFCSSITAQVGINTDSPVDGAILDINSSSKGFLMTRVALTATNEYAPITPTATPTVGLMVYNTNTFGSGSTQVTPGFYYWSGVEWRRLFNQGYTLNFSQTSEVIASTTTFRVLTGLDSNFISVPFDGTYQIMVSSYYAAGTPTDTRFTGAAQAAMTLYVIDTNNNILINEDKYVASASRVINGQPFYYQAENIKIIKNVELQSGIQYRFQVYGREWQRQNAGAGRFGRDTSGYTGSEGSNNAQRGEMIVTLIKQNSDEIYIYSFRFRGFIIFPSRTYAGCHWYNYTRTWCNVSIRKQER